MSLINEALKKAQRSRSAGADHGLPPLPGGGHVAKRGQAQSANTMVLLGSGAVVLVVLSVAVTIYLVNRPAKTPPSPAVGAKPAVVEPAGKSTSATVKPVLPLEPVATAATPPPPASATPAPAAPASGGGTPAAAVAVNPPSPTAAAPIITPAPGQAVVTPASHPVAPPVTPVVAPVGGQAATPVPTPAPRVPPAPASAAATPPRPDERIAAYVESIRIAGLRAQGADSRVLINERVYRVNDIIERTLGLRLIKVDSSSLTFADANGATYTKFL